MEKEALQVLICLDLMCWNSSASEIQGFPVRALTGKLSSAGGCPQVVLSSAKGPVGFVGSVLPRLIVYSKKKPCTCNAGSKISLGFADISKQVPQLPAGLYNQLGQGKLLDMQFGKCLALNPNVWPKHVFQVLCLMKKKLNFNIQAPKSHYKG